MIKHIMNPYLSRTLEFEFCVCTFGYIRRLPRSYRDLGYRLKRTWKASSFLVTFVVAKRTTMYLMFSALTDLHPSDGDV